MASKFGNFYDDFDLPGLDRTKWTAPTVPSGGSLTFPTNVGVQLVPSTSAYVMFDSIKTYDISTNAIFIGPVSASFPNTASTAFFELRSPTYPTDGYRLMFMLYNSSGWKLEARLYNSSGVQVTGSSGPQGTVTAGWNSTNMKYWRLSRNAGGRIWWQYSADATNWSTLAYVDGWPASTPLLNMSVHIAAGTGTAAGSYFRIRRVNTLKDVDRGSGYINDSMDGYPIMSMSTYTTTPPTQFGQWQLRAGTGAIIQDPNDTTLGQNTASLTAGTLIGSVGATVKDVDFNTRIRHNTSGAVARIVWRYTDDNNYWYVNLVQGTATLGYRSGGTDNTLATGTTMATLSTFYTLRIVHVGSEAVVYTDGGLGSATYGYPNTEIIRATSAGLSQAGLFGFKATTGTVYIKDVNVSGGITPAAPTTFATIDATQVVPVGWVSTIPKATAFEYMYLIDKFGNRLNIAPSYGDIYLRDYDPGSPSARTVTHDRPMAHGSKSFTRFHGSKVITLSLSCYKTAYQEANYYEGLIQRWCRAGWKSMLIYKPRGDFERIVYVEGTSIGRTVSTRISNQRINVEATFMVEDGGDYENLDQTLFAYPSASYTLTSTGNLESSQGTVRIVGPCTNPLIINQTVEAYYPGTLARLGLTATLDATEYVDLDLKDHGVQYMGMPDDAASYRGYLTTRDWFTIIPGRNAFYYTSDDSAGYARITWKDKF